MSQSKSNTRDADTRYYTPHKHTRFTILPDWLMHRREIGIASKAVWAKLCFYCRYGSCTRVTIERLATEMGCDEKTIRRAINQLKQFDLIEVRQQGLNRPNEYWMLMHQWMDEPPPVEAQPGSGVDVPTGVGILPGPATDPYQEPRRSGQNARSRPGTMPDPSSIQEVLQRSTRGTVVPRREKRPVDVPEDPPGAIIVEAESKQSAPKASWANREGDDYGPPLVPQSRGAETVASVTPIEGRRSRQDTAFALSGEFVRRLKAATRHASTGVSPQVVAKNISTWMKRDGRTPEEVRKMIDIFFNDDRYLKASRNPARHFVFIAEELAAKAASRLAEEDMSRYSYDPTADDGEVLGDEWNMTGMA